MPIGIFGKYPAKRDFIAVNMPRTILPLIENWVASALATSREALGRQWQDYYMVQPVWNFRLGPGIGGRDCLGAIIPSVDGVGRTFPLLIAAHAASQWQRYQPQDDTGATDAWLASVHERLMLALSDDPPRDPTELAAGLEEPPASELELPQKLELVGSGVRCFWDQGGEAVAAEQIREVHVARAGDNRSLWWTTGSAQVCAQTVSFDGMPDVGFMKEMMTSGGRQADATEETESAAEGG